MLCHALRELHPFPRQTDFKIVCIVTPETVDVASIKELRKAFDEVIGVEVIGSGIDGEAGLNLMGRPDLHSALTKLHIFRLGDQFKKLIYLDADVLPIRPLDHLFQIPNHFSACPDVGWPDCFNSGVMVFEPKTEDFDGMMKLMKDAISGGDAVAEASRSGSGSSNGNGSFDGADQGLLNEWFSAEGGGGDWNRLSFSYNVTPGAAYSYPPAYKRFGSKIHNIHFIGSNKPWRSIRSRPASAPAPDLSTLPFDYPSLVDRWFAVYDKYVRPTTDPALRQTFTVPETHAVWNQPALATQQGRQDLERLALEHAPTTTVKHVRFGFGSESDSPSSNYPSMDRPGNYRSLPIGGRVDLIRRQAQKPEEAEKEPMPSAAASPPFYAQPLPTQRINDVATKPDNKPTGPISAVWDAQIAAPPPQTGPEFVGTTGYYENAWDRPSDAQKEEWNPVNSYPVIPAQVKDDAWYAGAADIPPDRRNVKAVFPWEQNQQRHQPARVFPQGDSPLPISPPTQTESLPESSAAPHREASDSPANSGPQTHADHQHTRQKSFAESIASYTNAWDQDPSITRYVNRLKAVPRANPRASMSGNGPVSQSPMKGHRRESSSATHTFIPPPDDRSEDGDVEDSSTESEDNGDNDTDYSGPPFSHKKHDRRGGGSGGAGGHGHTGGNKGGRHNSRHSGRGSSSQHASPQAEEATGKGSSTTTRKYRERGSQTESVPTHDRRVQAVSPQSRLFVLPSDGSSANLTDLASPQGTVRGSPPALASRNTSHESVNSHFRRALFTQGPQGVTEVMTPSIDDDKIRRFMINQNRRTSGERYSSSSTLVIKSQETSHQNQPTRASRVFDPATSLDVSPPPPRPSSLPQSA